MQRVAETNASMPAAKLTGHGSQTIVKIEKFLRTLYSRSYVSPNVVVQLDTAGIRKVSSILLNGLHATRLQFCSGTPSRLLHSGTRGRKMNNFIANTFAEILSIIHLAAISCLGLAVWIYFENRKLGYGVFSEIEPAPFFLVIAAIFICYVIFFGILSTFVAININIQKLVTHFENVKSNS
jgi:hypothetical protein